MPSSGVVSEGSSHIKGSGSDVGGNVVIGEVGSEGSACRWSTYEVDESMTMSEIEIKNIAVNRTFNEEY